MQRVRTPNIQQKVEYMIEHWETMNTSSLAKKLGVSTDCISQWARRARMEGINLSYGHKGGKAVDWKELRNKYK